MKKKGNVFEIICKNFGGLSKKKWKFVDKLIMWTEIIYNMILKLTFNKFINHIKK